MLTEVKLEQIASDDIFNTPVLILRLISGEGKIPIWIGPFEGDAIKEAFEGKRLKRPLLYDTMLNILDVLSVNIERVVITELKNSIYYANIILNKDNYEIKIDSRPSDAITITLRCDCKIYISNEIKNLLKTGGIPDTKQIISEPKEEIKEDKKLDRWLNKLDPGDFNE